MALGENVAKVLSFCEILDIHIAKKFKAMQGAKSQLAGAKHDSFDRRTTARRTRAKKEDTKYLKQGVCKIFLNI